MRKKILIISVTLLFALTLSNTVNGLESQRKLYTAPAKGSEFIGSGIGMLFAVGVECRNMKADGEIYWSFEAEYSIDVLFMTLSDWADWAKAEKWKDWTDWRDAVYKVQKSSGTFVVLFADTWVVTYVYNSQYFIDAGIRPYNIDLEFDVSYWEGGDAPKPKRGIPGFEVIPALVALGLVITQKKRK